MQGAIREAQRNRDVVGHALFAEFPQYRIGIDIFFGVDPVANDAALRDAMAYGLAGRVKPRQRAVAVFVAIDNAVRRGRGHNAGVWPPDKAAAENIGMQRTHKNTDAP